jgi:aminoglycoside phosphotransferase (APT) family kinase protein
VQAGTGLFGAEMRAAWEQSLAAPIDRAPTWIHGDLHPRNILVDAGLLSAVIDWGDMAAGDCATDLACIWMMLEGADHRARALQHYGRLSQHDISRARGWAILLGTVFVDTGLAGDRRFLEIGARTLRRVAEGP